MPGDLVIPANQRRLSWRLATLLALIMVSAMHGLVASAGGDPTIAPPNLIRVHVIGLRSDRGNVRCSLFSSSEGFPGDTDQLATTVAAPIVDRVATCEFPGPAPGVHAVVLFHDENADGRFNRNWFGLPQEGYGFSNNARVYLRPPSFDAASFSYAGGTLDIRISIRY
jgi:uncharacterized protein (DUF2141 family)